jgi:hypothetical protein
MDIHALALSGSAVNLDNPGSYLHWNIFYVSVANLVLIAVMVVIFGAAMLLPFPGRRRDAVRANESEPPALASALDTADGAGELSTTRSALSTAAADDDDTAGMWTAKVRRTALRLLPPHKLLPDRQPAYVASWIYVFGVASLAALGMAIVSGLVIALGGVDWWHTNPVGHFFNSMHLWSVELFMALIVIHLWGKFWMAAWRGRRTMTWITGVVAFLASIIECFTGYLSQQNFDSQWISTSGKDAFNSVGVGAFFNLMNFGQMLLFHVVLIPIILIALVGAHILLVRMRGVVHPIGADPAKVPAVGNWLARRRAITAAEARPWRGPTRRYDIIKEGAIASVIVLALTLGLAGLLSSPDVPSVTVQTWSKLYPADFVATAAAELNGSSETASYGQPYNTGTGYVQTLFPRPQTWFGVTQPVNAAQTFVLAPLNTLAPHDAALARALGTYNSATAAQQMAWATNYYNAVEAKMPANPSTVMPTVPVSAKDGPVPVMLTAELSMAQNGAVDTDLLAGRTFYGTNFTKPLLFIEDGSYFADRAAALNLTGSQWGVMNETGSYPGQPWLWLYTLWYQLPGFRSSANVDMIAIYLTGLATILLLLVPFIPGLRDIPRLVPVHRLIWRGWEPPRPAATAVTPQAESPGTRSTTS